MHIAIASRIFEPEPSAASFRLNALATELSGSGHIVEVLSVRPVRGTTYKDAERPYRVKRFPVLRDKSGYVRGYLQYMSFDIPLFFRILFGPRHDAIVAEPPPTTGFFVRIASGIRRVPYIYYAADIWSDAAVQTGASPLVIQVVRKMELIALKGATKVLSVSDGVTDRLLSLGVDSPIVTIGNGVETDRFASAIDRTIDVATENSTATYVYAGTASELHGANVFIDAMVELLAAVPNSRLRFIGGGSEIEALTDRARLLGISDSVSFEAPMDAERLAPILRSSTAALASVRPESGYDFAFPTKLYSAAVCGAPLIYSGTGPAAEFVKTSLDSEPIGQAVNYDPSQVATAMINAAKKPWNPQRRASVSEWATKELSLRTVARRAVQVISEGVRSRGGTK